ncbi:hypothetical protein Dda_1542 [Drechslerella dactyloides]|uniref:Uncharacterized protein n=1 Tax=Drechslerella dactyloides TaxID=74499 RepID=A0AAD6J3N1_DREDA|nr:hypothetical protein Dda_1542 [Drechslerella dactyloides]
MEYTAYLSRLSSNGTAPALDGTDTLPVPSGKTYEPLLAIAFLYGAILLSYTSKSFTSFRQNHKALVATHAISNLVELAQFYTLPFRYPDAESLVPVSSVLLCLLQCQTNFALVRRLKRGNPGIVRTTYQGAGILRIAIIIPAYLLQSRTLYHDAIVMIHAFVYARFIIYLFTVKQTFPNDEISEVESLNTEKDKLVIRKLNEVRGSNKSLVTVTQTYTAGVYGAALIVVGHQEDENMRKYGMMVFLITMGVLLRLEQWVGDIMDGYLQGRDLKTLKQRLAWVLYQIGLCRISTLVQMDKSLSRRGEGIKKE